jgi:hypothetical protein
MSAVPSACATMVEGTFYIPYTHIHYIHIRFIYIHTYKVTHIRFILYMHTVFLSRGLVVTTKSMRHLMTTKSMRILTPVVSPCILQCPRYGSPGKCPPLQMGLTVCFLTGTAFPPPSFSSVPSLRTSSPVLLLVRACLLVSHCISLTLPTSFFLFRLIFLHTALVFSSVA